MYSTISLLALRRYLDVDEATDDTLLTEMIERAQKQIEEETGRVFEAESGTRLFHSTNDVNDDGDVLYLDEDLVSVTEVLNGDGTDLTSSCWLLPANLVPKYAIKLKDDVWVQGDYEDEAISVTGLWGWSSTAPSDVVQAIIRLAAYLYKQRDAVAVDTVTFYEGGTLVMPQGMPAYVASVIGRYRKRLLA